MRAPRSFEEWYDDPDDGVDRFARALARAVVTQLRDVKPEDREHALTVLQDHTSLYSPHTAGLIDEMLKEELATFLMFVR